MEMSLISRNFGQLGISNTNNNNLMIISLPATKLQMGFSPIVKSSNLSVRVSAQSVSQSLPAASTKASQEDITISKHVSSSWCYLPKSNNLKI